MYLVIYPDVIFILNFSIDLVLLILLAKINRKRSNWKRLMSASVLGAVSAVMISIFPGMNLVIRILFLNITTSILMLFIAFGRLRVMQLLKQLITLYLLTYFVGGMINSIYYYTNIRESLIHVTNSLILSNLSWKFIIIIVLLLIPATLLLLKLHRYYKSGQKVNYEVELFYQNQSIHTMGFLDTGNCLYDPFFKKPVMVMEDSLLKELLPEDTYGDLMEIKNSLSGVDNSLDTMAASMVHALQFRFIPYRSVGRTNGIMPALILDKVLIHTGNETICNEKVTAAICDNHLSTKDDYHVLLHKELI